MIIVRIILYMYLDTLVEQFHRSLLQRNKMQAVFGELGARQAESKTGTVGYPF